jgi:hypothetical protein
MSDRHRLDPLPLHHAAGRLGEIVGAGDMAMADAVECIRSWVRDGASKAGVDAAGLQMRLVHRMRDAALARRRALDSADTAIRWAVRPLFRARASAAAIEEAAGRANAGVLEWEAVAAVLGQEMAASQGRRTG